IGHGRCMIALARPDGATREEVGRVLRLELDGRGIIVERLLSLVLLHPGRRSPRVGVCVFLVELDGRGVVGDRLVEVAALGMVVTPGGACPRVLRAGPDGPGVVGEGHGYGILLRPGIRSTVVGPRIVPSRRRGTGRLMAAAIL